MQLDPSNPGNVDEYLDGRPDLPFTNYTGSTVSVLLGDRS
jgi:hypothetical protein